jgi:SAM-dependent methyltransferase
MNYEKDTFYQSLFKLKYEKIEQEIQTLEERRDKLKVALNDLSITTEISNSILGVDLRVLNFLACFKCSGNLILQDGIINSNQITEGKLTCNCGEEYVITSGILTAGKSFERSDRASFEDHISDYIHATDSSYLENIHRAGEWAKKKLKQLDINDKVLLDIGSGLGFFLRNIYEELPEDCLYIAVDRDLNKLLFLKDIIERRSSKRNILFICADFLSIPIQNHSVDIVIDQSGTSNYSFENEIFLLHELNTLFKHDCYMLSSFILFKNFSINSQIPTRFRENFMSSKVKEEIQKLQFNSIDERTSKFMERGGEIRKFLCQRRRNLYIFIFWKKTGLTPSFLIFPLKVFNNSILILG